MTKETLAYIGCGIFLTFLALDRWVLSSAHELAWSLWIPLFAILGWSVWQLRDKPDPKSKTFDFNPRRGFLYFLLGFVIFPINLAIDAIFKTEMSLATVALVTIGGSVFVGLVGTFTENVGV